jgi:hypothetical protein
VNGASGMVEVWLDGVKVDALTKAMDLGGSAIAHVQIGDSGAKRTYDVAFDDVAADESFIG